MEVEQRIAERVARELRAGDIVNLGIGIPSLVADYIPESLAVTLHTETGLFGYRVKRRRLAGEQWTAGSDYIDASGNVAEPVMGGAVLNIEDTFGIMRGGHLNVAVIGAYQVDVLGRVANWSLGGSRTRGMGGAMDLASGAERLIVAMRALAPNGSPAIVERLLLPRTTLRSADVVVTELGVLRLVGGALSIDTSSSMLERRDLAAIFPPVTGRR